MPKMAVFDPPKHPVTLGHVSLDPPPPHSVTYLLFMQIWVWTPQKRSFQILQQIVNRMWNRMWQFRHKI